MRLPRILQMILLLKDIRRKKVCNLEFFCRQVNIGLQKDCCIDKKLTPGVRVTVKLHKGLESNTKQLRTEVVSPAEPREKKGLYWGYSVRMADSLSAVFAQSPYKGGYDLTIGTSERGQVVDECQVIKVITLSEYFYLVLLSTKSIRI